MTLLVIVLGQFISLILVSWLLGTNSALAQTPQSLCERIHQSPQNLTLQAVSPLSDKLYLVLWDILYTVPFTDETVDSVRGTLTLSGIEPGTEWTQVPWLKSVVDSVGTHPILVGLNIWVEPNGTADPSQDHSIHVLFRVPASDVDKMIEVAWINQKGHRKAPWGVLTDESVQGQKDYKFVESVSCKPQLVMKGPSDSTETEMFLSYSDNQSIQISVTDQSCPDKDTTRPVLTWRPVFGFIHSSVVHLWDTRNGQVILFDYIEDNKMPMAMTVPVRFVPFVEYFVYTFKAADQDSNLLWIIVFVILIVGGAAAAGFYWFKYRHSKIAKNGSMSKVAPVHKSKTHKSLAPRTTSSASRPNSTTPSSSSTKAPFKMETFTDPETSTTTTPKGKSLQVSSMLNATGEMCQSTAPGLNPFQAFMVSSNVEGLGSVAPKASKVSSKIQDDAKSRISSSSSTSSTGFKNQNPTGSL